MRSDNGLISERETDGPGHSGGQSPDAGKRQETPNLIHWWFGSVFLTFFPTLATIIMSLSVNHFINFAALIGDGELVLCSFLISAGAAFSNYKTGVDTQIRNKQLSGNRTRYFYILISIAFLELISYSSVKLSADNPDNSPFFVYGISAVWTILSVFLAWGNERLLMERRNFDV